MLKIKVLLTIGIGMKKLSGNLTVFEMSTQLLNFLIQIQIHVIQQNFNYDIIKLIKISNKFPMRLGEPDVCVSLSRISSN